MKIVAIETGYFLTFMIPKLVFLDPLLLNNKKN